MQATGQPQSTIRLWHNLIFLVFIALPTLLAANEHPLKLTVKPISSTVLIGEPLYLGISLTNSGEEDQILMGKGIIRVHYKGDEGWWEGISPPYPHPVPLGITKPAKPYTLKPQESVYWSWTINQTLRWRGAQGTRAKDESDETWYWRSRYRHVFMSEGEWNVKVDWEGKIRRANQDTEHKLTADLLKISAKTGTDEEQNHRSQLWKHPLVFNSFSFPLGPHDKLSKDCINLLQSSLKIRQTSRLTPYGFFALASDEHLRKAEGWQQRERAYLTKCLSSTSIGLKTDATLLLAERHLPDAPDKCRNILSGLIIAPGSYGYSEAQELSRKAIIQ